MRPSGGAGETLGNAEGAGCHPLHTLDPGCPDADTFDFSAFKRRVVTQLAELVDVYLPQAKNAEMVEKTQPKDALAINPDLTIKWEYFLVGYSSPSTPSIHPNGTLLVSFANNLVAFHD